MSDKILRALMQLFAIIANSERLTDEGRRIVETFLLKQISQAHVQTYLEIFDEYLKVLRGKAESGKAQKRVSVNSVKVLRICTDINSELDQKQKYVVLTRLIEFAYSSDDDVTEQEREFLSTVADVFHIQPEEFDNCVSIVTSKDSSTIKNSSVFLVINRNGQKSQSSARHLINEPIDGDLWVLQIKSANIFFTRYFGNDSLTLNGQPITNKLVYVFSQGSVIRGSKTNPVYYSDVLRSFLDDALQTEISLTASNVEYTFRNGKKGLNNINFSASSGNLIGIMGGSGTGKSTLLNILNGNHMPSQGTISINGVNIHSERKKLEGVIGYVPQDDLLMEDLTVFQNLFYNSKLCFGHLDNPGITEKVNHLLQAVGLYEARNLKVGDALNVAISGGQRKRLNIALELIRTPSVLFVDEPTSGLSSLDSENVMDLLKQLSITGKLVFVVIHQPSSDIFKLFDKLLILDTGGYPIYYGNPSDSLIYFKNKANFADADVSECGTCGNINPEQVFSIIESKVMDEFGNPTLVRKLLPKEWNQFFKEKFENGQELRHATDEIIKSDFKKPSRLRQIAVFIQRDVLSKLKNRQYLLINFLEAPVLAFILSYFLKYAPENSEYIFRLNKNLPAFIFMGVIVALFMGLSVSAEEIIRDRKILKREAFLNLSKGSYFLSKIAVQFLISAIQTFTFVLIGNTIFGIKDMFIDYWLILFSVSCFGNLIGLNISSAFDSVVTIYILIPFIIIPQIILSGVLVKFEHLNPVVTSQNRVPLVGDIMASRWAFEALAVNQFKNNAYEVNFFETDKEKSNATFKKDFWFQKMNDKLDSLYLKKYGENTPLAVLTLKNELKKVASYSNAQNYDQYEKLEKISGDSLFYKKTKSFFDNIKKANILKYNKASEEKDRVTKLLMKNGQRADNLRWLQDNYTNESLDDLVLNANDFDLLIESNNELVQRFRPVYMDGPKNSFVRAPFYVSSKNVFGHNFSTYSVNFIIIWLMNLILIITLYFKSFRNLLHSFEYAFEYLEIRKKRRTVK